MCVCIQDEVEEMLNEFEAHLNAEPGGRQPSGEMFIVVVVVVSLFLFCTGDASRVVRCVCEYTLECLKLNPKPSTLINTKP
jgi:hypothetical protein